MLHCAEDRQNTPIRTSPCRQTGNILHQWHCIHTPRWIVFPDHLLSKAVERQDKLPQRQETAAKTSCGCHCGYKVVLFSLRAPLRSYAAYYILFPDCRFGWCRFSAAIAFLELDGNDAARLKTRKEHDNEQAHHNGSSRTHTWNIRQGWRQNARTRQITGTWRSTRTRPDAGEGNPATTDPATLALVLISFNKLYHIPLMK